MPRVFPHDLEAERSLLGSMLISKEACQDILNKCEDRDFYEESHKVLFNAMSELSRQNIPVDVTTITSYLLDHSHSYTKPTAHTHSIAQHTHSVTVKGNNN